MQEETTSQLNDVSLRDYLDMLRRRKAIIIQTFVLVMVVGTVVTFLSKPLYRSIARILVEGKELTVTQYNANDPLSNLFLPPSGHDVATQIEVLQSNTLLSEAYRRAGVPRGAALLEVKQVGQTDVIELTSEAMNPQHAERLAQAVPDVYLNYVTGNRKTEITKALEFAEKRYKEENQKLIASELALQQFRQRMHVADIEKERQERINQAIQAENEIRKAESDLAGSKAQLAYLLKLRKSLPASTETPTTTTNPQIEQERTRIAALKNQRASLLILYKPTHAKVQELDAQIADMEAHLAQMPPTVTSVTRVPNQAIKETEDKIAEMRGAIAMGQQQVGSIRRRVTETNLGLSQYGVLEIRQAQLQREVERLRDTVGLLGKSVEDLSLREKATHPPVLTITSAGPARQVAPRKLNNMIYAAIVGLILGFCFALLQEYLDDRINSPEDARRMLGAPILGYIPLIENQETRLLASARGGGSALESYRVLRSNVQFAAVDAPIASIMVTSTLPGEGKSLTASNLAVAMALDGRSVILVDADLRRPSLHTKFGLEQRPGLTNVLVGHMALEEALQQTTIEGLRFLASGPLPPNPAELLNSRAMRDLHEKLKGHADVVIFDSPPVLATADAQVLSAETDGVLYVVQFGEAKKSAMRHVNELFDQARAHVLGVVFNKIDLTSRRDDYYYGYYRYYDYYQSPRLEDGKSPRRHRTTSEFEAMLAKGNGHHTAQESVPALPEADADEREEV